MPTIVWSLVWILMIGVAATLAIRETRSGRRGPVEVDRTKHAAVRESESTRGMHGPGNTSQIGFGG